jgi:hypothetical protein
MKLKTVYRLIDFYHYDIPEHNDVKLRYHGYLDFSSLEKLNEMCNWVNQEPLPVICTVTVPYDYDNLDYVPVEY